MVKRCFIPSFEQMDMRSLYDLTFAVAVATGPNTSQEYLCTTLRGPLNFSEMVEYVYNQWTEHQNNSRVIVLNKEVNSKFVTLDHLTVSYIQERGDDIIVDIIFGIKREEQSTCSAATNTEGTSGGSS